MGQEDDRAAIHEAMEQQTISIVKAGITTTLNSRCSILAAANSVFGRWDDGSVKNIDLLPTILSRFDCIFILKDVHEESSDMSLARHVMKVHSSSPAPASDELPVDFLRNYIGYCRAQCAPRLTTQASQKLRRNYVEMRRCAKEVKDAGGAGIPITVRQLEALIRISESLAKMELNPLVTSQHAEEAWRLFQVSTLAAVERDAIHGHGPANPSEGERMQDIERMLKRRLLVGAKTPGEALEAHLARSCSSPRSLVAKTFRVSHSQR